MKFLLVIAISIIIVVLELTIFSQYDIFGARFNLLLAVCVAWAIFEKEKNIGWFVLIPAFLLDVLVGKPLGIITLSVWLTFVLIRWLGSFLFRQSGFVSVSVLSLIGVSVYEIFYFGFYKLAEVIKLTNLLLSWGDFYKSLPVFTIINSLLCLFLVWILGKIKTVNKNKPITSFKYI